jgi:hypothetical protein
MSPKTNLVSCLGDQLWSDFLDKATYGEMFGAKERHVYGFC